MKHNYIVNCYIKIVFYLLNCIERIIRNNVLFQLKLFNKKIYYILFNNNKKKMLYFCFAKLKYYNIYLYTTSLVSCLL